MEHSSRSKWTIWVSNTSLSFSGFTICIGNQFTVWNVGLTAGFASQLIALLLMGSAYICLRLCNTELESSFPFAGGAYGISRITLGLYPGFLIGCCEAAQFISYVADATFDLSRMLSDIFHKEDHLIPVFCLLFYMSVTCVLINGNRGFWKIGALLGMSSLLILLVFCFGSLPYINMARYTPYSGTTGSSSVEGRPQWFVGGMVGFMRYLPLAAWFYRGSGSLNLPGYIVSDSKTAFPMSSIYCILTQHFCSIFVLFVCASLPMMDDIPTAQIDAPLSVGFALMFKIPVIEARAFTIPALCVTVYGSIFAFSRILLSMSQSGLISPLFKRTCSKHKAPYVAILAGSALCYGLFLIAHFLPPIRDYLPLVCILFEISGSIGQFIGYVIFKRKYGHYAKDFSSPLGIWGAYYGGFVISLGAVAICVFQSDFAVLINTMGTLFFCSIYYFTIAKRRQVFSEKEKVFFPMQVIKCKKALTHAHMKLIVNVYVHDFHRIYGISLVTAIIYLFRYLFIYLSKSLIYSLCISCPIFSPLLISSLSHSM